MTGRQRVEWSPQDLPLFVAVMSAVIAVVTLGLAAWGGGVTPLWVAITFGILAALCWAQYRKNSGTGTVRLSLSAVVLGGVGMLVLTLAQQWWYAVCVGLAVVANALNLWRPRGPSTGSTSV